MASSVFPSSPWVAVAGRIRDFQYEIELELQAVWRLLVQKTSLCPHQIKLS